MSPNTHTRILVGSEAARVWWPDFRESKDRDYLSPSKQHGEDGKRVETFWHEDITNYWGDLEPHLEWQGADYYIAKPDFLYTLKVSHAFWALRNGSWKKHMYDIHWMQEKTNAAFVPEVYDTFYSIWEQRYGKKKANLNVSAEDFFTKTVHRVYDHDSIHASVAYYDRPLFNEILKDGHDVMVDRAKFEALSEEKKQQLVREECYATALERQVIPSDYRTSARGAYSWALMKTVTSFSKGWFPLYIVQNWKHLYRPDVDYIKRHLDNKDKLILL